MTTHNFTRQSIIEESLSIELSEEQQAQFQKLEGAADKAAYLEALLSDEEAEVTVVSRDEMSEITHIQENGAEKPIPVAKAEFTDELEARRKNAMPRQEYKVRFAEVSPDGNLVMANEAVEATSYADAVSMIFKDAIEQGRTIERVYPSMGENPPALIQVDRSIYDLTASAENHTTFHVGALAIQIERDGNNQTVVLSNRLNGEELDAMSISDADYKALLDQDQEPSGPTLR